MSRILVGVDSERSAEQLAGYCNRFLDADDTVHIVNSQVGGDDTSADDVTAAEEALDKFEEVFEAEVADRSGLIRGNEPLIDLLEEAEDWNADEFLIGIRKRSPVGKVVFGSTARDLLLESEIPVRTVPLVAS